MRSPVKPKKFLGQHFLKDLDIARRIADTLAEYKGMPVLEIGPGTGVLTQFLLAGGHDLTVVEIDRESVAYLRSHFPLLEGRILEEMFHGNCTLINFSQISSASSGITPTTFQARYFSKCSITKTTFRVAAA